MRALFGEGRHPNADQIERAAQRAGQSPREVDRASKLGAKFRVDERANEFARRTAGAFRDYNLARGLPAGAAVSVEVRASIRTDLTTRMFVEAFGRPPADARELSGQLARISRPASTAVAGFDLSFSPVKSVSTLWAIAPRETAEQIERAHDNAVADTLGWLEAHAAYTRRGRNGVAQVDIRGLIGRSSPTATGAPATPTCTPTWRSPTRSRPKMGAGWRSTGGCCSGTRSPRPSGTKPASKPSSSTGSVNETLPKVPTGSGGRPVGTASQQPREEYWMTRRC